VRGLAAAAALASLLLSCGYGVVRYSGGLGDVRSVAVDTPENASYEAGIEFMVADALRSEFLRRRAVDLVEDPSQADLVLEGKVLPIHAAGRSFSSVVMSLEYELTLELQLHALRSDGSEVALDARVLKESERYLASADPEVMRKNRDEALRRAAQMLAVRVYDALYVSLAP
jgi:hypothetical protein